METSSGSSISQTGTFTSNIKSNLKTNLDGFTRFTSEKKELYPYVVEGMRNVKSVFMQQGYSTNTLIYKEVFYRI